MAVNASEDVTRGIRMNKRTHFHLILTIIIASDRGDLTLSIIKLLTVRSAI